MLYLLLLSFSQCDIMQTCWNFTPKPIELPVPNDRDFDSPNQTTVANSRFLSRYFAIFLQIFCILLKFPSLSSLSLCVWTFFHVTTRCVCAYFSFYLETINSCVPYSLAGPNFEKWISEWSIDLFHFGVRWDHCGNPNVNCNHYDACSNRTMRS